MARPFRLTLPENILRKMNHKQYKQVMSWLRYCARNIHNKIDYMGISVEVSGEKGR